MFQLNQLRSLGKLLVGINCLLIAVYLIDGWLGTPFWTVSKLINLSGEANIPAWYSSAQLLVAGLFFLLGSQKSLIDNSSARRFLFLAGLGFIFLSADESAMVHERITGVLKPFESLPRFNDDHGMWIPIYLSIGVAFVVLTRHGWRNIWHLERRGSEMCLGGILLFLIGAVGVEIISYGDGRDLANLGFAYYVQTALEESLEMFGATALLIGSGTILLALHERARH